MADNVRKKPGKQPISRHPLFPATVALWFGALFGLGSLAIRPELLEQVVLALDLQRIVPAAAPPLGATARILVALAMAGLGAVVGAVLARRLAQPRTETRMRKRNAALVALTDEDHLSPFERAVAQGALDETNAETDAEAGATPVDDSAICAPAETRPAGRRRFLAGRDEARAREAEGAAAASDNGPPILNVAEFDLESFDQQSPGPAPAPAPAATTEQEPQPADVRGAPFLRSLAAPQDDDAQEPAAEAEARPGFTLFQRFVEAPAPQAPAQPDDRAMTEQEPTPARGAPPAAPVAAGRIASASLDALSHVELLERLAMAMERRRREAATVAAPAILAPVGSTPVEPVEAAPETLPDPAPRLDAIPAALRPIAIAEDEDDEDGLLPGYVPPRHISMPRPLADEASTADDATVTPLPLATRAPFREAQPQSHNAPQPEHAPEQVSAALHAASDADAGVLEEGYSSLLNLSSPVAARAPLARIEEPDDGTAAPATLPHDPEQALRAALAALQRMSGTA